MSLLRHLIALLLLGWTMAAAQPRGGIEVRLVAERLPRDLGKVVLASGEERSEPFVLPMNNLSEPLKATARSFQVISIDRKASIANVTLPNQGSSFVVLLIPAGEETYTPVIIPHKDPRFKAGDIFLYNNAKDTVVGKVGDGKFSIDPGKGDFFRPIIKDDDKRYHDVGIGVKFESGDKVISTTRWPKSNNTRYYVFFYVNLRTKRVTYRAVDEFLEVGEN